MIFNNLKIAWRSLRRNKVYTGINIIGLAIGIAAVLLIFRMLSFELSFNKDFENYDRIARVVRQDVNASGNRGYTTCLPQPAGDAIESSITGIEKLARVKELWPTLTVPSENSNIPSKKFNVADAETAFFAETPFLNIFDFEWIVGDQAHALDAPGNIVLTKTWAVKCFEDWNQALGKQLLLDNQIPLTVTGVMEDLPENVDFVFPFLVSYETLKANPEDYFYSEGWHSCSSNDQMYILLEDAGDWDLMQEAIAGIGAEEYVGRNGTRDHVHSLQPLSDLHFSEQWQNSGTHRISKKRLSILGAIGILILVMACFNFINLATAQSTLRSKEVGVRKTLGSSKMQLTHQFLTETGLIVAAALILGMVISTFCLPLLQHISEVPNELPFLSDYRIIAFLLITGVSVTLLAGLYPALSMSRFRPVEALKSNYSNSQLSGSRLRKSLVVFQFVIAQGLIIAALINIRQLDYIQKIDLGFSDDLVYTFGVQVDSATLHRQSSLKNKLLQIPNVEAVSLSSDQPLSGNTWATNFRYASRPEDEQYAMTMKFCDENYSETYGIEPIAGRWLTASDTMREAVVNMTVVERLGLDSPEDILNQTVRVSGNDLKVVGVTEDFHTHSVRQSYKPLLMTTFKSYYWQAGVKMRPGDLKGTLSAIQQVFDEVLPEQVMDGQFLDESIAEHYGDEERLSATTKGFGFLAILISCLGLFGLATHAATQRLKEIGVRKVLGATIYHIVGLLSKDFLKLIFIALLVATPIAWYLMRNWLDNFVYRTDMPYGAFIIAGLLAMLVAFLTVSYQSIKAATTSPIKSLRDE